MTVPRLSRTSLPGPGGPVQGPGYDPAGLTAGIVHLGPGAFHRAHMARYVDAVMQATPDAHSWGIVGAGLTPFDQTVHDALQPQDWLYTLVERDDESVSARIIGAIIDIIPPGNAQAILARIDQPGVRIVSLTVSENGYCLETESRRLDLTHPAVIADLASPGQPASVIGLLVEAYRRRRVAGRPAFTALSCDNLPGNGRLLQAAVIALADRIDPDLGAWIACHATFPGTMVDRITPVTTADDARWVEQTFGIGDAWPICSEPFTQWVIEDRFADGRPGWEAVGVELTSDVRPFELRKLRLLNASHLALASLGFVLGQSAVADAMRDPRLNRFVRALMAEETATTVTGFSPREIATYQEQIMARFSNRTLNDSVERVNRDASITLLLDPVRDRLAAGQPIPRLSLAVAAWICRLQRIPASSPGVRHPLARELQAAARTGGTDPAAVMAVGDVFGSLRHDPVFVGSLSRALQALHRSPSETIQGLGAA